MSLRDFISSIRSGFPISPLPSAQDAEVTASVCEDVRLATVDVFEKVLLAPACHETSVRQVGSLWQKASFLDVDVFSLQQSRSSLREISFHDPLYGSLKTYVGHPMKELLSSFPFGDQFTHIQVVCADGYNPDPIPVDQAMEGFLAVGDRTSGYDGAWKIIPRREETPEPAYLFWPDQEGLLGIYNVVGLKWVNLDEGRAEANVDAWLFNKKTEKQAR